MNKQRKQFLVNLAVGLLIAVLVICINWKAEYTLPQRLCDGFFVAAVMLLGGGGLKFARNQGTFDMISFSMKSVLHIHFPGTAASDSSSAEKESFADYRERKQKERKSPATVLYAGLLYLILSVAMLILYFLFS